MIYQWCVAWGIKIYGEMAYIPNVKSTQCILWLRVLRGRDVSACACMRQSCHMYLLYVCVCVPVNRSDDDDDDEA